MQLKPPQQQMPLPPEMQPMPIDENTTDAQLQDDLNKKLNHVKGKMAASQELNASKTKGLRASHVAAVQQVFDQFKKLGVDFGDPVSTSSFLQNLQQRSPDMFDLLVTIFGYMQFDPIAEALAKQQAQQGAQNPQQTPDPSGGNPMSFPSPPGAPPFTPGGNIQDIIAQNNLPQKREQMLPGGMLPGGPGGLPPGMKSPPLGAGIDKM